MTQPDQSFIIIRGTEFERNFLIHQFNKHLQKISVDLNQRRYTVKETGLGYRVLSHWSSLGLIPKGVRNDGWHKFSLVEIIWFRACMRFRKYGVSLQDLAKIKEGVMVFNKIDDKYPKFEYYVVRALFTEDDPQIVVPDDFVADVATMAEIETSKVIQKNFDMLLISVKSLLEEVGYKPTAASNLFSLTKEERELLKKLRLEKNTKLNIDFDKKTNKINEIESVKDVVNPTEIYKLSNEIKNKKEFGQVTTTYVKGEPTFTRIIKKKKIK